MNGKKVQGQIRGGGVYLGCVWGLVGVQKCTAARLPSRKGPVLQVREQNAVLEQLTVQRQVQGMHSAEVKFKISLPEGPGPFLCLW